MKAFEKSLLAAILFLVGIVPQASAQSFSTVSFELGLYCAKFPDNSTQLVRLKRAKKGGNTILESADFNAELTKLRNHIKQDAKRIAFIKKQLKEDNPSKNLDTYLILYKHVYGKKFKGDNSKLQSQRRKILAQLSQEVKNLESDIKKIERCFEGDPPPPSGGEIKIVEFPFTHPDFGVTYYMFGVAITAQISPKLVDSVVCVSGPDNNGEISVFPFETEYLIRRNPCAGFFQNTFRNFPTCSGAQVDGNPNTATGWIDVGFSQSPATEAKKEELQKLLDKLLPANIRPPSKKNPCLER